MANDVIRFKEVVSFGWKAFKKNALIFIVLLIISFAANLIVSVITGAASFPAVIASILATAVGSYFALSMTRASYAAVEGSAVSWEVLKKQWQPYFRFFIIFILLSIIFVISAILLIIPLLFTFPLFLCVPFIFVENPQIGIIEVFQKSWNISIKHVFPIMLYVILCFLIIFATTLLTLGLALLITIPLFYITSAYIYKRLNAAYAGREIPIVTFQEAPAADDPETK
ncbi:MAG: hypothetical protein LBU09_00180 [Endomicrobium sp.]|jgi:hypothetical protein|nr:hypothetical protein [Endomicrobium sp.]